MRPQAPQHQDVNLKTRAEAAAGLHLGTWSWDHEMSVWAASHWLAALVQLRK